MVGRKKIAFIIYRSWGYEIFKNLIEFEEVCGEFEVALLITSRKAEFNIEKARALRKVVLLEDENDLGVIDQALADYGVEVACFYSWSWIIREPILGKYICLCLHPSRLPQFRGGSPIQNQIIAGVTESALSHFRMKSGIDDGDIHMQVPFSLAGSIADIFDRMASVGGKIARTFVQQYVRGAVEFVPQKGLEDNPPLRRRTPAMSEIKLEDLNGYSYRKLSDMVRALAYPYPNVFIVSSIGCVVIQEAEFTAEVSGSDVVLNVDPPVGTVGSHRQIVLALSDGYARLIKWHIH
jgi:methionyl-tRNA formyltransferase